MPGWGRVDDDHRATLARAGADRGASTRGQPSRGSASRRGGRCSCPGCCSPGRASELGCPCRRGRSGGPVHGAAGVVRARAVLQLALGAVGGTGGTGTPARSRTATSGAEQTRSWAGRSGVNGVKWTSPPMSSPVRPLSPLPSRGDLEGRPVSSRNGGGRRSVSRASRWRAATHRLSASGPDSGRTVPGGDRRGWDGVGAGVTFVMRSSRGAGVRVARARCPEWDSNPHWIGFEPIASAGWAIGAAARHLAARRRTTLPV